MKVERVFRFSTSLVLPEATGLRAATLPQLLQLLREAPESCVYHHTHYFLLAHHYLKPQPTNDFAYWVTEVLGEQALGEQLASIDPLEFVNLAELRAALLHAIETHIGIHPMAAMKFVAEGEEFFFIKAVHVVLPTRFSAATLASFASALEQVSINSLYYHLFDARLRLGRKTNDFAEWASAALGLPVLAEDLARFDLYSQTLEGIRDKMLARVKIELQRPEVARA